MLKNQNGELQAELSDIEDKPLKLRGEVVTQIDEVRGDSTWTVSRVHLTGKGNLEMVLHVSFDAENTEGSALLKRGNQTERLQIIDSDNL
ncbi:MAG: hypothetical protein IPK97_09725 [Ahniella sp.]|nr:hypothetical protein [Ahniella sp.]